MAQHKSSMCEPSFTSFLASVRMAYSALHAVGGVVVIMVAQVIFGRVIHIPNGPPPEVTVWLRPILSFVGWLLLVKAAAGLIAGWGLLQRENWARTVALVVGF